ncbi:PREDICTED: putative B3 domain-containing protein At5g58280 isoform X2 [Ipomoea nil]|uniref:putative B3 domain-containing protein At5g58280 isoform X2 n=1 Tax=Ipomoea nil TaxID=35883 RepID=UPI000900CF67|nr:PREDICTED: putative B3 domain-containing protein At5g58280 isoform X2 [Ipomoea nil]
MANDNSANSYEEARKQRVLDNKKRFEDLGILKISKSLSDLAKSEKKSPAKQLKVRHKPNEAYMLEPRRSSRARNPAPSYRDDIDVELPSFRKRSKLGSSWASYLARPIEEVKTASYEERSKALKEAEKLQSNLQSENPSFVKSMVRSHVYSCFWLGLPTRFCEDHLPKSTVDIVLEDEEGAEYDAVYISKRTGLSGGWRAFALDHKLDDGDALVFDLVEPTKFKVYIVRASHCSSQGDETDAREEESGGEETKNETAIRRKKRDAQSRDSTKSQEEVPSVVEETKNETTKPRKRRNTQSRDSIKPQKEIPTIAEETKEATQSKDSTTLQKEASATRRSARLLSCRSD